MKKIYIYIYKNLYGIKNFFWYSINMFNLKQNEKQNEIEQIKKEINLLQEKLKKTKKNGINFKTG